MSAAPYIARPVELRLFPLESVLFPGATLPMRAFETRYRLLVAECLDEGAPFGIVLIAEGESVGDDSVTPRTIGTTARITEHETDADGHIVLNVVGERRFRIRALHRDRPYLWAEVDYPEDSNDTAADLSGRLRADYSRLLQLRAAIAGGYERAPSLPAADGVLADRLAADGSRLWPPEELQAVLEALDVGERIRRTAPILAGMLETSRQLQSIVSASRRLTGERLN